MSYDFNIYTMSYKNNLSYWLNQTQTFIKLKQAIKYNSFRDVKLREIYVQSKYAFLPLKFSA